MATTNNKKKARNQITCERDLVDSLKSFNQRNGFKLEWLHSHVKLFTEGRSSAFYDPEKTEFRLIEPVCGAAMTVHNTNKVVHRYKDHLDIPTLTTGGAGLFAERSMLGGERKEFNGYFCLLTNEQFFTISLVRIFQKWLTNMLKDAEANGFKAYFGVGHAHMILLEGPTGERVSFSV